jgi:sugar phosphate isomerase/epimerase
MATLNSLSRRDFLLGAAGAGALLGGALPFMQKASAMRDMEPEMKICVFSKHLQWRDYKGTGETAADIGFDGVDLTVRPGGHVLPERVEEDLPKAVEAIKKAGSSVPMMVTRINDPSDPTTTTILRTAAKLGIKYYRMGSYKYNDGKSIPAQLADIRAKLKDLAALNQQYNLHGAYQNHSGSMQFGAPVWDIWYAIQEIDPRWMGCQFDIRHATVEGGQAWPTHFQLIAPHVKTIIAKDFVWEKTDKGWRLRNCPLNEGMVNFPAYFKRVKQADITGPISLHLEYDLGGAEHGKKDIGSKKNVLSAMRKDLAILKRWLHEAKL